MATSGGLLPYANRWLEGEISPWYPIETQPKQQTVVEKLIARRTWKTGTLGDTSLSFGIDSVVPGDQVLCSVAFRGMHEYTAGMCMALYKDAFGVTPVVNPDQVAAFEDHFVLIDEPTVPDNTKTGKIEFRSELAAKEMTEVCDEFGLRLHGPVVIRMRVYVIVS